MCMCCKCDNLQNAVLFHIQLTCDYSNSQLTIVTLNLTYIDLSSAYGRPTTPKVIFHLFSLLSEALVSLKHVCMTCWLIGWLVGFLQHINPFHVI